VSRVVARQLREAFDVRIPITVVVLALARLLSDEPTELMARDALHAAVVEAHGLQSICSYDQDFDRVPGLMRVEP